MCAALAVRRDSGLTVSLFMLYEPHMPHAASAGGGARIDSPSTHRERGHTRDTT